MKKTTRFLEEAMKQHGLEYWVATQRRWKWRWAGHVARMPDERWAKAALLWAPSHGSRRVGRPCLRWEDSLENFVTSYDAEEIVPWYILAQSQEHWQSMAVAFSER